MIQLLALCFAIGGQTQAPATTAVPLPIGGVHGSCIVRWPIGASYSHMKQAKIELEVRLFHAGLAPRPHGTIRLFDRQNEFTGVVGFARVEKTSAAIRAVGRYNGQDARLIIQLTGRVPNANTSEWNKITFSIEVVSSTDLFKRDSDVLPYTPQNGPRIDELYNRVFRINTAFNRVTTQLFSGKINFEPPPKL